MNFQWLENEFLPYLDRWEKSVIDRQGFSDQAKKRMMLSTETLLGLRVTGNVCCMCYYNLTLSLINLCSKIICGVC